MEKKWIASLIVSIGLLAAGSSVRADQAVSFGYQMPLLVSMEVNMWDCDNSPGPWITLDGSITMGGLGAQLIFQNNVKGTHQAVETISQVISLIPEGGTITIPKQPVRGGAGGNPWVYLQLFNDQGNLTPEILLGRCVQGLRIDQTVLNSALVSTLISASDCSNNPGPWITFQGGATLSGLQARLVFKNNVKGTHTAVATTEVELLPPGYTVVIPKQPVNGGVGGNPWIWVQYLDSDDLPLGDKLFLGRCVQM